MFFCFGFLALTVKGRACIVGVPRTNTSRLGQKGTIRDKVERRQMQEKKTTEMTREIAIYGSDERGHLCKTAICKWDPEGREHYLEMKQGHRYIRTPLSVIRDAEAALSQEMN